MDKKMTIQIPTIDLEKYLVLGHSRPGFRQDFTCLALLKNT